MAEQDVPQTVRDQNDFVRAAWDANAQFWDGRMGEGNDFFRLLIAPAVEELMGDVRGARILEVACGNGNFARRLAAGGATVLATDFAPRMLEVARARSSTYEDRIEYRLVDATDGAQLQALPRPFDAIVCNMGIMDMAAVEPLAAAGRWLLKRGAPFVFSVQHPCFNSGYVRLHADLGDDGSGHWRTAHWLSLHGYSEPSVTRGEAMFGQPALQLYFHRPPQQLLGVFFETGYLLDGLKEPVFPPEAASQRAPRWENLPGIPPVLVLRMRNGPPPASNSAR